MRLLSRPSRALAIAALALAASCGGDTTGPPEMSAVAAAYLEQVIGVMEANSIFRLSVDWPTLRTEVLRTAAGAQSIPDTYNGIARALRLMNDDHSVFRTVEGIFLSGSNRQCAGIVVDSPDLPPDIGYVRVRAFSGAGTDADQYARDIQAMIEAFDGDGLAGWVVDLRGNTGGNMWPMLAAVGPVLGEAVVGAFVSAEGTSRPWEYRDGAAFLDGAEMHRVSDPYALRAAWPRVAVLTDNRTVGAGDALAIAFRGRPDARSFGQDTCGLSTGLSNFTMSDGAVLSLAVAVMADRTGTQYGDFLRPDVVGLGVFQPVDDAIDWLRSGD
jgi:carboxyl-terminal processing protease